MRVLITGVNGFIGSRLAQALQERGDEVIGLARHSPSPKGSFPTLQGDITRLPRMVAVVKAARPDWIFHLAAQSNIPRSLADPMETMTVNVIGTLNVLEAVRLHAPRAVLVSAGSSAEYGQGGPKGDLLDETVPLNPTSPYGISKAAQGMLVTLYARIHHLQAIHVRPFAVIGPGKAGDALSDFCRGVVAIERGESQTLPVGNLTAIRDFIDVRDCVSALITVATKGEGGTVYNLCHGRPVGLEEIITHLRELARRPFEIILKEGRLRPADDHRLVGDGRKIARLGYRPRYSLDETVKAVLNYWRREGRPTG